VISSIIGGEMNNCVAEMNNSGKERTKGNLPHREIENMAGSNPKKVPSPPNWRKINSRTSCHNKSCQVGFGYHYVIEGIHFSM